MGCKAQKAARIIGVDVNEDKFEMGEPSYPGRAVVRSFHMTRASSRS
jgi:hypothetical protein